MKMTPALDDQGGGMATVESRWLWLHAGLPLVALAISSAILWGAGVDHWIADHLYQLEGRQWQWKNAWLTKQFIHQDGKRLSILAGLITALIAALGWRTRRWATLRWPATYVLLSVTVATLCVSGLKRLTAMDCPWDLIAYGGSRPYIGLFTLRHGIPASGCFPAGHASAGYAWVALYFIALGHKPRWRWYALALGVGSGCIFGLSQQLRGAHFLSHDLWSLAICWYTALSLYWIGIETARIARPPPAA